MLFARWVGNDYRNEKGSKIAREDDIIEIHARGADRTKFVCRCNRNGSYFWGDEKNLEWCSPVAAEDVVHDFNDGSRHYSHFKDGY